MRSAISSLRQALRAFEQIFCMKLTLTSPQCAAKDIPNHSNEPVNSFNQSKVIRTCPGEARRRSQHDNCFASQAPLSVSSGTVEVLDRSVTQAKQSTERLEEWMNLM